MQDETPEDAVGAVYDEVIDAILAFDDVAAGRATSELILSLSLLADEASDVAVDIALDLVDGWDKAEDAADAASDDEDVYEIRLAIAGVVAALADSFSHPILDGIAIEMLNELGLPQACVRALKVLEDRGQALDDDLGQSVLRALIVEAGRQESLDQPISVEVAGGLRAGLGNDGWLPDPMMPSDLAVVVAWADFTRDDLRRLEATMDLAVGPFCDPYVAAQAALLRVMVAFTHADIVGMERALRVAAPAVKESGDPRLVTAYRLTVEMMEQSRGSGGQADLIGEFEGQQADQGKVLDDSVRLFSDCLLAMQEIQRTEAKAVPDQLRARVDAWCAAPVHPDTDPMVEAILWWIGHGFALIDHDPTVAVERLRRAEQIRDGFGEGAPQAIWFEPLLAALSPALPDPRSGVADAERLVGQRHREAGSDFIAYLADTRLAMAQAAHDPQEAFVAAVRAVDFRQRHLATLPGSSERVGLREQLQDMVSIAFRSAHAIGDPRLMAELLEFLRAQDMPVVDEQPSAERTPFGMLLPPAAFGERAHAPVVTPEPEAVVLELPKPVRMPWGDVALSGTLPIADQGCTALVVPLPPGEGSGEADRPPVGQQRRAALAASLLSESPDQ